MKAVLLDSGPLGLISNANAGGVNRECAQWLAGILDQNHSVFIPEIADYEVRRELLRAGKPKGVKRLNELQKHLDYLPLTTDVMLQAAYYWATTRKKGRPTADSKALDGDVILAAQAAALSRLGHSCVVATTNVKHLEWFVDAQLWKTIT